MTAARVVQVGRMVEIEDRVLGCIVGGAIGDALGRPYEGQPGPVAFDPDAPWRLSDDTQLTLATCDAVCACGAVSPAAIADRFAHWFPRSWSAAAHSSASMPRLAAALSDVERVRATMTSRC
jgi:ADP-ribosylglycohydrolase